MSGFGGRGDDKRRGAGWRASRYASGSTRAVPRPLGSATETGFGLRDGAVEIRNQQVSGSSPLAGSRFSPLFAYLYWDSPRAAVAASARVGCT